MSIVKQGTVAVRDLKHRNLSDSLRALAKNEFKASIAADICDAIFSLEKAQNEANDRHRIIVETYAKKDSSGKLLVGPESQALFKDDAAESKCEAAIKALDSKKIPVQQISKKALIKEAENANIKLSALLFVELRDFIK